jgi:RNA polymerase sigma-70 factor, ECF subfamily
MDHASESELVARCQAGDQEAFGELVDQYKNLVFGVISQVVPDRSRVDDLAQDVFLKIHRGLPSFRGEAKLSTWIYRIVRNVCCEARSKKVQTISLDERDDDGRLVHQPAVVDRAFTDLELRDQLEKAIAHLPADWRLLISAHYFGGLQYQELAETFEMPIGTVKAQLHRAKQKLRGLSTIMGTCGPREARRESR